jgi:Ser/Thr protein kinase RdoA (MazF antagonist)
VLEAVPVSVLTRPALSVDEATAILEQHYARTGVLSPFPSERDQNFLVAGGSGGHAVLKIANAAESREALDLQNRVMERLARSGIACPSVLRTVSGDEVATMGGSGVAHRARLLTYLPGRPLFSLEAHHPHVLEAVGRLMASVTRALAGFSHPAAGRPLQWNVWRSADVVAACLPLIGGERQRQLAERVLARLRAKVVPAFRSLRASVIHNDANDHNVLADDVGGLGLVDFGDVVRSSTANEPAVACAYAMLGQDDPLGAAAAVVSGYHDVFPLDRLEVDLLFDLIRARLCTSVCLSAYQRTLAPDDPYLVVSERPAWELLERLDGIDPVAAAAALGQACADARAVS